MRRPRQAQQGPGASIQRENRLQEHSMQSRGGIAPAGRLQAAAGCRQEKQCVRCTRQQAARARQRLPRGAAFCAAMAPARAACGAATLAAAAAGSPLIPGPTSDITLTLRYWISAGLVGFRYTPPVRWAACARERRRDAAGRGVRCAKGKQQSRRWQGSPDAGAAYAMAALKASEQGCRWRQRQRRQQHEASKMRLWLRDGLPAAERPNGHAQASTHR